MNVLGADFVQGFIRMANYGWEQGWHGRNGGRPTSGRNRRHSLDGAGRQGYCGRDQ